MTNKKSILKNAAGICLALCAAALIMAGCGGGFGTDSGNADDAAPGIFGKDSSKNR